MRVRIPCVRRIGALSCEENPVSPITEWVCIQAQSSQCEEIRGSVCEEGPVLQGFGALFVEQDWGSVCVQLRGSVCEVVLDSIFTGSGFHLGPGSGLL